MHVINLFAGPGAGKSTTAAGIFNLLKLEGFSVELVTEYAKDLTWDKRWNTLEDQLYVFAKQHNRLFRLRNQVEWVVTDSPILLSLIYAKTNYLNGAFEDLVHEVWQTFDNHNFFINRVKNYVQVGRSQTEQQARKIDADIKRLLHYQSFKELEGNRDAPQVVLEELKRNGFTGKIPTF